MVRVRCQCKDLVVLTENTHQEPLIPRVKGPGSSPPYSVGICPFVFCYYSSVVKAIPLNLCFKQSKGYVPFKGLTFSFSERVLCHKTAASVLVKSYCSSPFVYVAIARVSVNTSCCDRLLFSLTSPLLLIETKWAVRLYSLGAGEKMQICLFMLLSVCEKLIQKRCREVESSEWFLLWLELGNPSSISPHAVAICYCCEQTEPVWILCSVWLFSPGLLKRLRYWDI